MTNPAEEQHECSICGRTYIGYGNNASPYAGRCCDECNTTVVVPTRMFMLRTPKKGIIDWADPAARLALIERVGHEEYGRLIREHFREQTVTIVNGYDIRKISSTRLGQLFMVDGSPDQRGFATLQQATEYARALKRGDAV